METNLANARETLTDLVLEFLEAAVHEFLFAWHVYPKEAFEQRLMYDVPIHMVRHPLLCDYIHSMLSGCRTWLSKGQLEKFCVVLVSERGLPLETLAFEPRWVTSFFESGDSDKDRPLPLLQLEESFRAGMVALVATSVSDVADQTDCLKPHAFQILAQTVEDGSNRETSINDDNVSRSWVPAGSFWYDDRRKEKEILPVRAIQSAATPVRLLVYIEKHHQASQTKASE